MKKSIANKVNEVNKVNKVPPTMGHKSVNMQGIVFAFLTGITLLFASGCAVHMDYKPNEYKTGGPTIEGICLVKPVKNLSDKRYEPGAAFGFAEIYEEDLVPELTDAITKVLRAEHIFGETADRKAGQHDYVCSIYLRELKINAGFYFLNFILNPLMLLHFVAPVPSGIAYSSGTMGLEVLIEDSNTHEMIAEYKKQIAMPEATSFETGLWWDYVFFEECLDELVHIQMVDLRTFLERNKHAMKKKVEEIRGKKRSNINFRKTVTTEDQHKPALPKSYRPSTVAVWQLTPLDGIPPNSMLVLTETLRSSLLKSGRFKIIARGEMEKVMKEQNIKLSDTCDTTDCAVDYGELLSVEKIMVGSIGKVGKTYQVVVKLIDVRNGEIEKTANKRKSGDKDVLFDLVEEAGEEISR